MTRSAQSATIARPCGAARRDWRKAQRSLDLTVRHSNSRRPAAPIPSPKEGRRVQITLARSFVRTQICSLFQARRRHSDEMREKAPLSGSPQSGAASEHALRGKGAIARKQKESRSFKRLSCSLARIATPERTFSYMTALRNGALTKQVAGCLFRSPRAIFGCRTRKRPCREAERTETYVSIHDKGADIVLRQIAPSVPLKGTVT